MRLLITVFTMLIIHSLQAQVLMKNSWCTSRCNMAGDEKHNTKKIFSSRQVSTPKLALRSSRELVFPLRLVRVNSQINHKSISDKELLRTIEILNNGFSDTGIQFELDKIVDIASSYSIEDLADNGYQPYNEFSNQHDLPNTISILFFDYDPELCIISPTSISCGRTGGFSYILSELTNNIVLSKFDIEDQKVITHEMGHFFGLYHTFEEDQFGKDNFVEDCNVAGDCICDTPPDPGPVYEVYVNHSQCRMQGLFHDNGNQYQPEIENYMSYYKPCYLREFSFTEGQKHYLGYAANSEFRKKFAK